MTRRRQPTLELLTKISQAFSFFLKLFRTSGIFVFDSGLLGSPMVSNKKELWETLLCQNDTNPRRVCYRLPLRSTLKSIKDKHFSVPSEIYIYFLMFTFPTLCYQNHKSEISKVCYFT